MIDYDPLYSHTKLGHKRRRFEPKLGHTNIGSPVFVDRKFDQSSNVGSKIFSCEVVHKCSVYKTHRVSAKLKNLSSSLTDFQVKKIEFIIETTNQDNTSYLRVIWVGDYDNQVKIYKKFTSRGQN